MHWGKLTFKKFILNNYDSILIQINKTKKLNFFLSLMVRYIYNNINNNFRDILRFYVLHKIITLKLHLQNRIWFILFIITLKKMGDYVYIHYFGI